MQAQPRAAERTLVKQIKLPLAVCVSLVVVGSVAMLLILNILCPDFANPRARTPKDSDGESEAEDDDEEVGDDSAD